MNRVTQFCTLAATALLATGLQAEEVGKNYFDVMLSGALADRDKLLDDGFAGGSLRLGREMDPRWNLELAMSAFDLDGDSDKGGVDWEQFALGANALAVFNRGGQFQPFLLAGLGVANSRFEGSSNDRNFYGDLGAGAIVPLANNRFRLRGEVLYRAENDSFNSKDWILNVGFGVPFGKVAAPVAAVVAAPVFIDSDGDGVEDALDQCPNTPRGAAVDAVGCELDSDGDGVVDSKDRCPGTKPGIKVDATGCPIVTVINLQSVNFRINSDQLLDGAAKILDADTETLLKNPNVMIEVAGHTDSTGTASHNLDLSQRRASTVRNFLIANGVDADRIVAKGYGQTAPIADNGTAEGRTQNRRVELRITDK